MLWDAGFSSAGRTLEPEGRASAIRFNAVSDHIGFVIITELDCPDFMSSRIGQMGSSGERELAQESPGRVKDVEDRRLSPFIERLASGSAGQLFFRVLMPNSWYVTLDPDSAFRVNP